MSWSDVVSGRVKPIKDAKYEGRHSFFKIRPEFFHREKFLYVPYKYRQGITSQRYNTWDDLGYGIDFSDVVDFMSNK